MKKEEIKLENTTNKFEHFLKAVEFLGNKLPDITILFLIAFFIMVILSWILSHFTFNYFHPTTGEQIKIINMLAPNELAKFITKMISNFVSFPPLGITLVGTLGIGVANGSGFIRMIIIKISSVIPEKAVTPAVMFISILSHISSDSAYVILMPVAAMMFFSFGKHPLAGIAASFAGLAGGHSASYTPSIIDPIMQGFTQNAARMIDPTYTVNVLCNYFLSFSSTFAVILVGWFVTDRIVEPFLWRTMPIDKDAVVENTDISLVSKKENKAFNIAILVLISMIIILIALLVPKNSLLRAPDGQLTTPDAPIMQAIVPVIFLFLVIPGFVYGKLTNKFKTSRDFSGAMADSIKNLASFLTFAFFCSQFLYMFGTSNVGTLMAISGAEFLKSLNMPPQVTIAGIILLTGVLDILISSASSKWAIMAPVLVPMLMAVGISPELTQASYRVSDSAMNIVTPMFSFYPLIISYCQKYCKKTGVGTLSSMMIPYSIGIFIALLIMLYGFWALNIPIGFNSGYVYPPVH
ncbi:aminobenzoyl-glutamate transporter [Brachyspira hyodysenteriae]|uniref:Aminobenzoyl-glutamate transporter n=1 Tax=Brachyspira hyodysenteriae ATCC 27164 TaxID=1266923 RepID=A0A3B6VW04_BRAHO|nr:AbgT family transporter [Brachyspira hyodysenteriae]ANN62716.1 aminobenzoyl-glutamate transporter [Brachyspira hyodysenteriae ATCC 27164]KLI15755.1 aminobenzoyl-glutamate transporter [Brachyspira hyodysenteriae]KLI23128.1 aminobenzoyl-glutamate transporter [Brachyspira hyodysenteriae]MCZ9926223.1 AbgT family transporter [Brachyspira hyodysenteriae]MDA0024884.1 AbgT family transporter [Brachyspira hyodysenteriae]